MPISELSTDRLRMRQWQREDYPLFATLNGDAEVMQYFTSTLSLEDSNSVADKLRGVIEENGWGLWATELKATKTFIGFVGLNRPAQALPFTPCVEIGWRLAKQYWGNGYATEAARAVLDFAFIQLELEEVVSFTAATNAPSRAVMDRLGMQDSLNNFMHPQVPEGHKLQEHVLYKIRRNQWQGLL